MRILCGIIRDKSLGSIMEFFRQSFSHLQKSGVRELHKRQLYTYDELRITINPIKSVDCAVDCACKPYKPC